MVGSETFRMAATKFLGKLKYLRKLSIAQELMPHGSNRNKIERA